MKIGVIADDFTGASDIALFLAEGGMQVAQYVHLPDQPATHGPDAGVVALKSRTARMDEAVAQSLAACNWLLASGAQMIVLKVCSTFDSTDQGNIGPVLDALSHRLEAGPVVVCPALPDYGRSVYQAHLFVGDRLLSESGMQDHPLTPMTDPDLRRVLGRQTQTEIAHIAAGTVMQGADAITSAMPGGHCYVITDAIRDVDLIEIGRACRDHRLICGGSGIALGLPSNFGLSRRTPDWTAVDGPGAILSGSCSRATRQQVSRYSARAPAREISVDAVLSGDLTVDDLADWALGQRAPPLIYSSADPDLVRAAQGRHGTERAAETIEAFFSDLARALVARGVSRLIVAGGETSGAVVTELNAPELRIGPRIAAGVPVMRLPGTPPVAIALKSGNFGGPDFFAEALETMRTDH